jgi:integrase/predicted RNA-binding Zn-ribbon protein involved in translation (DUF1610 family)
MTALDVRSKPICPECGSTRIDKAGFRYLVTGSSVQRYQCQKCGYRFSEPTNLNADQGITNHNQICALKVKNLENTTEIKAVVGEKDKLELKGKLLQFAFYCQKEGMKPATIRTFNSAMMRLSKIADINNPESVKEALGKIRVTENTKVSYCVAYTVFLKFQGKSWCAPRYKYRQKLPPFLPTEEELNGLIAGCGTKTATILQLMKETGMRIGECLSLTWISVNFEKNVIILADAEKGSLPRVFRVSTKLLGMIGRLSRDTEKIFRGMKRTTAESCFRVSRKRIAKKLINPRIAKIHFHLIRHWFGTMLYHKTKDMDHVRRMLGHRNIMNTQIYVNMEQAFFAEGSDDYTVKVASTVEEAKSLIEVGFEYVTDMDGKKLFRKRK